MSLSTIIAKVILKILEAFGIKPKLQPYTPKTELGAKLWGIKQRIHGVEPGTPLPKEAFGIKPNVSKKAENLYTSEKRVQENDVLYTRPVETLNPAKVSQDSLGHKLPGVGIPGTPAAHKATADMAGDVATEPVPILPPEATDPTDAPDWLDELAPDWQTHVSK